MGAKAQAVPDGAHAVLIKAGRFGGALRLVVVGLLFRIQLAALQEMHRLVEYARIASRHHIATGRIRQPQIVVGEMGAHALSVGRMPPVLHVALAELAFGATDQLLAGKPRRRMNQCHGVLQLVAEAVGAAGLVIAAAPPQPARQRLVKQPAVGEHIERGVRRLHMHCAQRVVPVFPHRFQRLACAGASAVSLDELLRFFGVASRAEDEHDLALLSFGQFDSRLDRRTGIQAGAGSAGQALATHGGGTGQRAVAANELGAAAAHRSLPLADVGKHHPVGTFAAVGIAGEQCAADRIRFGDDMHQIGVAPLAEHQFPIPGQRQAARAPRAVAQLDHHELHRGVHGDVGEQFRSDARFVVLEYAVAEPVPAHVAGATAGGQGRRRPERTRFLVADIDRLAAAVGKRVIVPGGQAELVRVFRPGIRAAALADDRADVRAGDHVDPRRRRGLAGFEGDHVFAPVGREAAQAVAENAFARRQRIYLFDDRVLQGLQTVRPTLFRYAAFQRLDQRFGGIAEHDAGDGLQQDPLILGQLFGAPHEDAARFIDYLRFRTCVDQPHDLVMQHCPVAREVLVHDHQVRGQTLHPPIGMGLQRLLDQVDTVEIADAQQDDRQIARNGKAPQSGLSQLVAGNDTGRGAAQGMGVNDGGGQTSIDLGLGFACVEVAQHLLALEPGHLKRPLDEVPVGILLQQGQCGLARVGDAGDDLHGRRFVGRQGEGTADRHDGVEHRPRRVRQGRRAVRTVQHHGVGRRSAAADEPGAVGLVRLHAGNGTRRCQQVEHPWHLLPRCATPPRAEDRLPLGQDFGLHEQVAEAAVGEVGIQRGEHDLRVARHLDVAGAGRMVGERDAADLDVVLG